MQSVGKMVGNAKLTNSKKERLNNVNIYNDIVRYVDYIGKESENTKKSYMTDITQFFILTRGKEIKYLNESDLIFTNKEVISFQLKMLENYAPSSVNRKLSSIRKIFKHLKEDYNVINLSMFNMVGNSKVEKNPDTERKVMTREEYEALINEVKNEQVKADEKELLFKLAYTTSIRLEALLSISENNFHDEGGINVIKVKDKGSLNEKPIMSNLYDECRKLMDKNNGDLFTISSSSAKRSLARSRDRAGLNKRLTFHSLKKGGMREVKDRTKDIKMVQQQGNHKDERTSLKYYMDFDKDYKKMGSYLIGEELDLNRLHGYSKEELINAIKSANFSVQCDIMNLLDGDRNE